MTVEDEGESQWRDSALRGPVIWTSMQMSTSVHTRDFHFGGQAECDFLGKYGCEG